MARPLSALLIGGCSVATVHVASRLIAPYAGLGLTLSVAIAVSALAGFAVGAALGAGPMQSDRSGPLAARALLVAAALTLLAALARRPLLVALSGVELRLAVALASALFAGRPCAGLVYAFAASRGGSGAADAMRGLAWLLAGAALAAPLVGYLLAPRAGLTLTLAIVAAVEVLVALAIGVRRAPLATVAGAIVVLAAAGVLVARPATAARLGPRMLELRQGLEAEYRVFDRDGARYVLADGSIQDVVDTLSGDCVQRGPAALELLKLFRTGRDSMLVLGLRGGALPWAFARSGWRVHVVEPDRDAIEVARRVSYRPGEMALDIAHPRRFLERHDAKYGVIVVDAFAAAELPWALCTREAVAVLADRLAEGGLVVMSVEAHGWDDPWVRALAATLRTRFAHVLALPTSEPQNALGTVLLLASRDPVPFTDDQLPDPTTFFQNPEALWVVQQQLHAWLNRYEPESASAPVLSDDRGMTEVWADRVNRAARAELHEFFGPHGGSW